MGRSVDAGGGEPTTEENRCGEPARQQEIAHTATKTRSVRKERHKQGGRVRTVGEMG